MTRTILLPSTGDRLADDICGCLLCVLLVVAVIWAWGRWERTRRGT